MPHGPKAHDVGESRPCAQLIPFLAGPMPLPEDLFALLLLHPIFQMHIQICFLLNQWYMFFFELPPSEFIFLGLRACSQLWGPAPGALPGWGRAPGVLPGPGPRSRRAPGFGSALPARSRVRGRAPGALPGSGPRSRRAPGFGAALPARSRVWGRAPGALPGLGPRSRRAPGFGSILVLSWILRWIIVSDGNLHKFVKKTHRPTPPHWKNTGCTQTKNISRLPEDIIHNAFKCVYAWTSS